MAFFPGINILVEKPKPGEYMPAKQIMSFVLRLGGSIDAAPPTVENYGDWILVHVGSMAEGLRLCPFASSVGAPKISYHLKVPETSVSHPSS